MSENQRLDGLRREYEAGRIDANTYIAAGGDPDVVQALDERNRALAAAKKAADEKSSKRFTIGCLGVIALLIGGCWAASQAGKGGGTTPQAERYGVTSTCEKAVRQQLKDPDSAKFDWDGVSPTSSTDAVFSYSGSGTVRATNSFGGIAVHSFTCTGSYTVSTGRAEARATIS